MNYCFNIAVLLSVIVIATSETCPKECICTGDAATCNSINLSTKLDVNKLHIDNPTEDLKLTPEIFKNLGLTKLQTLNITNANIVEISGDAFKGLNLFTVIIRSSIISSIPSVTFSSLPNLRLVDLSNSNLVDYNIISESVDTISLSGCNIKNLPEDAFAQCTKLSTLNLADNLIEEISPTYGFIVDYLNLANNKIKKFFVNGTESSVVHLDLSNNPIESIDGDVTTIEELTLRSCNLTKIEFLNNFTDLIKLDLAGNNIQELKENAFMKMEDLEILDLSNNQIQTIPEGIFSKNGRLSQVVFNGNNLKTLPIFKTNGQINQFSCNNCGLEKLNSSTFWNMQSLTTISLTNNHFKDLPREVFFLPNLNTIDLSNNALTTLHQDTFIVSSPLKNVILANNPLISIQPELFRKNRVLKTLDVSSCFLRLLWSGENKTPIPSLETLNAEHNLIGVVSKADLNITPNIKTLLLNENNFECNSVYEEMRSWILRKQITTKKNIEEISSNPSRPIDAPENYMELCDPQEYPKLVEDNEDYLEQDTDNKDDDSFENDSEYYNDENYDDKIIDVKDPPQFNIYPESNYDEDKEFREDAAYVNDIEHETARAGDPRTFINFLLPTLVFVLTALIVLIFTVSVILCILKKKNSRGNIPQINIIPWGAHHKMKVNSGIVYQPLSEEKIPV